MPVNRLFVEGELDTQLLRPILEGHPLLEAKGSKNSLAAEVRREREKQKTQSICYLRDRDFDFEPPDHLGQPTVDRQDDKGSILGWRWSRLEIENYMLEPRIVRSLAQFRDLDYESILRDASQRILFYEAARWTIGQCRSLLPRSYDLATRPEESAKKEFFLPDDLSLPSCLQIAKDRICRYQECVIQSCNDAEGRFDDYQDRLAAVTSLEQILLWWSGKDLMKCLESSDAVFPIGTSGAFRSSIRDWMIGHPDEVLAFLPEWRAFRDLLRT